MVRTQIQLTNEQAVVLKKIAAKRRISMAEVIRQAVDQMADNDPHGSAKSQREKARAASGKFRSGRHDLASAHDRYLAEDFRS